MVEIRVEARCLNCSWTDESDNPDLAARKHEKVTQHSTVVSGTPRG